MEIYRVSASRLFEGMGRPYVVNSTIAVSLWRAVSNKTIRPDPVDMLYCASRLLGHDLTQARIVSARRSVGNSKVASCSVAVEEHLYTKDLVVGIVIAIILRQWQLAVGSYIYGNMQRIFD